MLKWRGELARRLIAARPLADNKLNPGVHRLSKLEVQHLALVATSAKIQLDAETGAKVVDRKMRASIRLWSRLQILNIRIPAVHMRVAQVFFSCSHRHFSEQEAACMLTLEYPAIDVGRLNTIADDLARWGVIQRIDVDGSAFYDIEVKPHLHIYSAKTGELSDAPRAGVLRID